MQVKVVSKVTLDSKLLLRNSNRSLIKYMEKKAKHIERLAKIKVGKRTGRLRRSIRILDRKYVPGKFYSISVGSRVNYAHTHHEGSLPYTIRPNSKRVLKFKSGPLNIYARSVRHPRIAPNRYLSEPLHTVVRAKD